jgi:hypothetical protein
MLCTALIYSPASGLNFHDPKEAEDSLSAILSNLNKAQNDSVKQLLNHSFFLTLRAVLEMPSADQYPFDSLKTLVKLESPDHKFRIFHWNLPNAAGHHQYYGFLKVLHHDPPLVFELKDKSDSIPDPDTVLLDNTQWFGSLYYKVIPLETAGDDTVYTLLGWSGKNTTITRKVIEVLSFGHNDRPYFGKKIFQNYPGLNQTRIIFRYAATTSMSLKLENKVVTVKKGWNSKKRVFETAPVEVMMIVFDRMMPLDPQLQGQYQFYVPEGDICDGFAYINKGWSFMTSVGTRNEKK